MNVRSETFRNSDDIATKNSNKVRRSYAFNNGGQFGGSTYGLNGNYNAMAPLKVVSINKPPATLMISEWSHEESYLGKTWFSVIGKTDDVDIDDSTPHARSKRGVLFVDLHVESRTKAQLQFNNYQIFMNTQP